MQRYRIAFLVLGGITFGLLAWVMVRDQWRAREVEQPISTMPRTGRVGFTASAMTLELPSDRMIERDVWFTDLALAAGVDFRHFSGNQPEQPLPAFSGSGVGAIDFDKDGNYDLYFGTGTTFPIQANRHLPINRCYRNLGNWQFTDVTSQTRMGHNGYSTGIAVGDFDNDGFPDVYVCCLGPDCLYRNQGDGTFLRGESSAGLQDDQWGMSAAFADIDNDGLLDLYVCNYVHWTWDEHRRRFPETGAGDRESSQDPAQFEPEVDLLYRNLGDGRFENISVSSGIAEHPGRSMGVVACDLNDDGRTDFAVTQDLGSISLRLNRGDGTFAVRSLQLRDMSSEVPQAPTGSYHGIALGELGLFVTAGRGALPALLGNAEAGFAADPASQRIEQESRFTSGWGCAIEDFDLDGKGDIVVVNGSIDPVTSTGESSGTYAQRPQAFKNTGGELKLIAYRGGTYFMAPRAGRGLATVDLDNDGDRDLAVNHLDGHPAVLRNSTIMLGKSPDQSTRLTLIGLRSSRDAVGSRITARLSQRVAQFDIPGGGSYLSAHDRRVIIGMEANAGPCQVEIRWPNGDRSTLEDLRAGESYTVIEPLIPNQRATMVRRSKRP